ncbi:MAG: pre-peptidase C-terminal domain-containing protein [Pleurocapsa sp. MO_192.B19]|nr:pre-peptidase C-terminal domain-containing protein [Pleurocapsa sp. MO_192.B19]
MAEVNLGSVLNNTTNRRSGFVGGSNTIDTFSFRVVNSNSNVNLSLTGMTADADIRLFRDFNENGIVDSNDRRLATSVRGGRSDESITLSTLATNVDPGSYVVEVDPFSTASTRYDLKVSASANRQPSLLLPAEREVGTLNSRRTFNDSVSTSDTVDTYRFNVTSRRTYSFSTNSSGPVSASMRLIQDSNNNREVNFGEEIARDEGRGGVSSIFEVLNPGTYYLQVYNDAFSTNYSLTMS